MSQSELLSRVVGALNVAGLAYMITGSLASSIQGEPRFIMETKRWEGTSSVEGGGILLDGEYTIRLTIQRVENGQYLATSNDLAGLVAQGRTISETVEIAQDVARKLLESYREQGDLV